ncbi:OmpA family protein [Marinoscillum pacificum]|uniref:OmpA family protein n=1 Tax=Marinoscillum pacificum TaxID=392723 RepID=UPI0021584FA1|nr:OmpA family protein [Marinoscillum pacificum]
MKRLLLLTLLSLSFVFAKAQETIVWGTDVVDVSSEYSPLEYSAIQALHKPNVIPGGGDNPNAWRPKTEDRQDFIMVSFDKPIKAKQVAIGESENPGAVTKVFAYDNEYNEYLLFELTPRAIPLESRLLNLFFDETPYEIYAIRVEIDGGAVPGYNAIDAIGVSASNLPITVLINLVPGIAQNVEADKLGANVNSQYIEHSPIISPDGKRLYFSRRYHPDNVGGVDDVEDIWVSELDEATGEWLPAKNLGAPLNTAGPNFISSITIVDGKETLILGNRYGKKGRMYSGVSMTTRDGDTFKDPVAVEVTNDYNYSPKVDYFLGTTGNAMIISSERDDSYGGRDLYVSFKNGNEWSEPKNLGNDINTAADDFSPFLGMDGKTLYFTSSGYSGYGGADIYVSIRLDNSWERWSTPENLGSSVNSEGDDQYFSIPSSGRHIYFSRGTIDDDTDIFRFKANDLFIDPDSPLMTSVGHLTDLEPDDYIVTVKGVVTDDKTGEPMGGVPVILERLPDGVEMGSVTSGKDGEYKFSVRGGARYGVLAKKEGFLSTEENFDLNDIEENETRELDLNLAKIETGVTITLNNIFFDFDKSELKTASYPELNRLLKYLNDGDIKKIEISGHTDATGEEAYNKSLSDRRAKAVYNFFRENGIEKDRLVSVGYGEEKPVAPNDTKENRAKNRRVEFKVVE